MATITQSQSVIYEWPGPGEWTYDEYCRLPEDGRFYEVIGGNLYMSPAPRPIHQEIVYRLVRHLGPFVEQNKLGKIYFAPIDVILPDLASPVQPDLLFIAQERLHIVKEQYIEGVPDLIVEVLSPTNPYHDRRIKYDLYAEAGVREYWLVDPTQCQVDIFTLHSEGIYVPFAHFEQEGVIHSQLLTDLQIPLTNICQ
jgi:Uma2 family endonuclease